MSLIISINQIKLRITANIKIKWNGQFKILNKVNFNSAYLGLSPPLCQSNFIFSISPFSFLWIQNQFISYNQNWIDSSKIKYIKSLVQTIRIFGIEPRIILEYFILVIIYTRVVFALPCIWQMKRDTLLDLDSRTQYSGRTWQD